MKISCWTICLGLVSGVLATSTLQEAKTKVEGYLQQVCMNATASLGDDIGEFKTASTEYLEAAEEEVNEFIDAKTYNVSDMLTTFSLLDGIKTQVDDCKNDSFIDSSGKELSEPLNELVKRFEAEVYDILRPNIGKVERLQPKVKGPDHNYLKSLQKHRFDKDDPKLLEILTTAYLRNSLKEAVDTNLPIVEQNLKILEDMKEDVDSKKTFWLRRPDRKLQAEYTAAMTNLMEFKQYLEQIKSHLEIGPELPGDATKDQETDSTTGSSSEETSSGDTETSSGDTETSSGDTETSSGDDNPPSGDDNPPSGDPVPSKILKLSVGDGKVAVITDVTPQTVPTGEREGVSEVTSDEPGVFPGSVEETITPVTDVVPPIVLTGEDENDSKEIIKNEESGNKPGVVPRPVGETITPVTDVESTDVSEATGKKETDSKETSEDSDTEPSLLKRHKSTIIVAGICIIVAVGGVVVYYLLDGSPVPS